MAGPETHSAWSRNVRLNRWYRFFRSLTFWQAVWFLYFQLELSAAQAILLYALYDIATTLLEVPSGYASDRIGRRRTLMISALGGLFGASLMGIGGTFPIILAGQILIGVSMAFASGTDESFLYESLKADGRADQIEQEELSAWRYSYVALMLSAVTGGLIGLYSIKLTFFLGAIAFAISFALVLMFKEPETRGKTAAPFNIAPIRMALQQPTLRWLFAISVLMYGFSHLPYVFGQPFIIEALDRFDLAEQAPLVSGTVTMVMMGLSLLASLIAPGLRARIGLGAMVLLSFAMQVGLAAALALTNSLFVVALLFLRMVPDAFSRPFVIARIQPLLPSEVRATYLSVQSLCGRILFAASLWVASGSANDAGTLPYAEIQQILGWYVGLGLVAIVVLLLTLRFAQVDAAPKDGAI